MPSFEPPRAEVTAGFEPAYLGFAVQDLSHSDRRPIVGADGVEPPEVLTN